MIERRAFLKAAAAMMLAPALLPAVASPSEITIRGVPIVLNDSWPTKAQIDEMLKATLPKVDLSRWRE